MLGATARADYRRRLVELDYGAFYKSARCLLVERINAYLMRWIRKKYQRLRGRKKA